MGNERLLKELNKLYGSENQGRDVFGKRPAAREDFGRKPVTPKQILSRISPKDFAEQIDNYLPTDLDIKEKEE